MEKGKGVNLQTLNEYQEFYWLKDDHLDKGKANLYPERWVVAKKYKDEEGNDFSWVINVDDLEDERKNIRQLKLIDRPDNEQIVFLKKEDALAVKDVWESEINNMYQDLDERLGRIKH